MNSCVPCISDWHAYVFRKCKQWRDTYMAWLLGFQGPLYPLFYENLKSDLSNELLRIFKFLGIQLDPSVLACAVSNQEGSFHRKARPILGQENQVLKLKDLFTHEMILNITAATDELSQILQEKFQITWRYELPS